MKFTRNTERNIVTLEWPVIVEGALFHKATISGPNGIIFQQEVDNAGALWVEVPGDLLIDGQSYDVTVNAISLPLEEAVTV